MKKIITIAISSLLLISCGEKVVKTEKKKVVTATSSPKPVIKPTVFLEIRGEEPFWHVEISPLMIKFISVNVSESFEVPYATPAISSDGNTKIYKSKNPGHEIQVIVMNDKKCTDKVSENGPEYITKVMFRKTAVDAFKELNGCATHVLDSRLNFVWRLQQLKGQTVTPEDFGKELPYIDLHVKQYAFTGFAGCNRIKGDLKMEEGTGLKFNGIIATKMTCLSDNKENLFMDALQNADRYEIHDTKLYLYKGTVLFAVLQRVT